ncbi:hypothetical protein CPB84DRAFT_1768316, partial [Gymnopilus junonius]
SPSSPLLLLAPELTLLISDEREEHSSDCHQLAECLSDAILHSLTINITKNDIEGGLSKLAALANSNHAAARATRELCIRSLSPAYDPSSGGLTYKYSGGRWVVQKEPEDPPEVVLAAKEVKANLFKAITSLKSVESVFWVPCRKDSEWAQLAVQDSFKEMPGLRRFGVMITDLKIPLPITLNGLQEISVEGSCQQDVEGIYENIAKIIATSPQLTSVDIGCSWDYGRPIGQHQSLHQLFKYLPCNSVPLQLRRLSLTDFLVRLDNVTLPHLSHLTSLVLHDIEDPFFPSPYLFEHESPEVIAEKKRYGLDAGCVRLEEIDIDNASPSLAGYLSSYSGMKRLRLSPRNFYDGHSSDEVARHFFAKSLRSHCCSLQDLQIDAIFEGLWCFGEHNLAALVKCENLHSLSMAVISSEIQNDSDSVENVAPGDSDTIKQLLDTVVTYMPLMSKVGIQAANLESLRDATCGNPAMRHYARVGSKIAGSVNNYVAPSSCLRLPSLAICSNRTTLDEVVVPKDIMEPNQPLRYAKITLDRCG